MFRKKKNSKHPFLSAKAQNHTFTNKFDSLSKYEIGDFTYGKPEVLEWGEGANLRIGKYCSISKGVEIFLGGNHRIDWVSTYPFNVFFESANSVEGHPSTKGDVEIGNDVWIGRGATILSGVRIGDGSVIAAKSVVTKDVLPYEVVGGNPQRHIKFRFSKEIVDKLLKLRWWDLPVEKVSEISIFLQSSPEKLLKHLNFPLK